MKILLDAFGGDNSPSEIIKGAVDYVNNGGKFEVCLVGNESTVKNELNNYSFDNSRIMILNSETVISCDEAPTEAIRKKSDSSMVVALNALRTDASCGAFVSAGSTGAFLAGAVLKVGRVKGVSRPALTTVLPTINGGKTVMLDVGANADCKPINLFHFAIMGNEYAKQTLGIKNPRVALLSNGTEDKKGNELIHSVFDMLKNYGKLNFVGNMEAREILSGNYDVIVSDGFSGNIALKGIEGTVLTVMNILKTNIKASKSARFGYLFMKDAFSNIKKSLDYNKQGGAVLLGIEKVMIKSHGSSKAPAITATLRQAEIAIEKNVNGYIKEILESEEVKSVKLD